MAFIQRSTPTTQKDFSANAFINNTGSKRKKSSIPSKTFFGTCFHRNDNDAIEKIDSWVQKYMQLWEKIPSETENGKYRFILKSLVERHKFKPEDVIKYIRQSNDRLHFEEAIPRHIDLTKEKVGSIIRPNFTRRKDIEMQQDFYVQQKLSGSLQRKQTIEAGLEGGVTYINGIKYSEKEMAILKTEFMREKGRNPKNNTELKEYLEFDSYPLNLLEYIRIEGHPPLNREILNKFIEQRKK